MTEPFAYYLVMLFCNITETSCMLLMLSALLGFKHHSNHRWIIWICLLSCGGYFITVCCHWPAFLQYLLVFSLIFSYSCFCEGRLLHKVLASASTLCLLIVLYPLLVAIERKFFTFTSQSYPFMIVNESIILFCAWTFWKFFPQKRRVQHLSKLQSVIALFYPCVTSVMMFVIVQILLGQNDPLLFLLLLLLFVSLIAHLLLTEFLNIQNQQKLQLSIIEQRSISEREKAEALLDAYTTQRKLTHEFTNHLSAINAYLHLGQYDQAEHYIDRLSLNTGECTLVINTHDPLADAILSQKYSLAAQKGIHTLFHLCDLSDQPMENPDLVVVLSNLFNNAIEGSTGVPNGEIHIKLQNTENEFMISFRNKVAKDIPIHSNCPPSSTKKSFGHGMGLLNVIEISKKYHGSYSISCRDHWFQVTVLINKASAN